MSYIRTVLDHFNITLEGSKSCCPFHEESTPSFMVYEETESSFCWGQCNRSFDSIDIIRKKTGVGFKAALSFYVELTGDTDKFAEHTELNLEDIVGLEFNAEVNDKIKENTGTNPKGYRGLKESTTRPFGVRFSYNQEDGSVDSTYFPATIAGELSGYKVRRHPKIFPTPFGVTGKDCDMFGQFKFKTYGNTVLIVGGEFDQLAAYQMLSDAQKNKQYDPPAVVSSLIGEGGAFRQAKENYSFFDQFKKIIVCMDNDKAGKIAENALVDVLPRGRVFVMNMRYSDPNEYLMLGKESEFISDFWNAKPYVPDGVKSAMDAFDEVPEEVLKERISLPPYMHKMQEMMGGGIIQGRIFNIIADTSVGKSTHVDRMVYHWIFNSPVIPTIVSLEATAPQYVMGLLSVHLQENLLWKKSGQDIVDFLETPEGIAAKKDLAFKPDGSPRFYIIDERAGSIKALEEQMEMLHKKHGSKLFIIDVLTDALRGSNEQHAEDHLNFQKNLVKDGVTIGNVLHTRKPLQDKEGKVRKVTEFDALGTGSYVQSAAYNIVLNRDKMSEDPIIKNTTEADLPKCRGGKTGAAGEWYYDFNSVQCHDLQEWLRNK